MERAVGYMKRKGDHNLIDELKQLEALMKVGIFRESLGEMSQLMKFCKVLKVPLDKVCVPKNAIHICAYCIYVCIYVHDNQLCMWTLQLTHTFHSF